MTHVSGVREFYELGRLTRKRDSRAFNVCIFVAWMGCAFIHHGLGTWLMIGICSLLLTPYIWNLVEE